MTARSRPVALLSDPFLQRPRPASTEVAWFTEFPGDSHHVLVGERVRSMSAADLRHAVRGGDVADVRVYRAQTVRLTRTAEDADSQLPADRKPAAGIVARDVYRHHAAIPVTGPARVPYRVLSTRGAETAASDTYSLRGPFAADEDAVIMLTSDHQLTVNTPANLEFAARVITEQLGPIDAVFMAGDLVNVPDRASEWFDDQRGTAFFPAMQGRGAGRATDGTVYRGGQLLQHAVLYPIIGNHEVQGRRDGHVSLAASFDNAVPRAVAEAEYARVAATDDPGVKDQWVENNSFSTTTFTEIFALPGSRDDAKPYYACTVGGIRLVALFATRVWRADHADPDPAARGVASRYQESMAALADPLSQGHGSFLFEDLGVGSSQYEWLRREVNSTEFRQAGYRVVMLHEGPHGLGENVMPHFAHPVRRAERDDRGHLTGIRYDYPTAGNILLRDVVPLLENSGVDLVYSGHSHLWNRFVSPNGVNYLEASNTGNSFGAFHPASGARRASVPPPWDVDSTVPQGNPGLLDPVVPTVAARRDDTGSALPYIADNNLIVFQALHTGTGTVTSWYVDMADTGAGAVRFDEFTLKG